jgi:catechol 2,3-dioxygenase-like lactoylglutathione lyase family enzyme
MSPGAARGLRGKAAKGAMHHLSFDVPAELLEEYRDRLTAAGVEVTDVVTHTDEHGVESIRAIYFRDPDGIVLEFSAWTGAAPAAPTLDPARAEQALARRREGIPVTV